METNHTNLEMALKIFTFRDSQVMLDKDLAILYGIQTKRLIEQVKRNLERFPESFMFQLSVDEISRSQFATLKNSMNTVHSETIPNSRSQFATLKNSMNTVHSETIPNSRSQFATLNTKQGKNIKYRPEAVTEQGITS